MLMNFGKYRWETCDEVLAKDPIYVDWVLKTESGNPYFKAVQDEFRRLKGFEAKTESQRKSVRLPWWDVLEIRPTDSLDVVKRAFRKQMGLYHPDKVAALGADLIELANQKTKDINHAYEEAQKALK